MTLEDDETTARYAFLLQPIRDLQKNWDIDISHLLEEFVERIRELSETSVNEEMGTENRTKFNFAEAAILIQGSTMVYGKKVEYVHSLARDFYEQLKDKKSSRKIAPSDQSDNRDGVEVESNEAIEDLNDPCELIEFTNLRTVDWKTLMLKSEIKSFLPLPQTPVSLMPLADFEKTNVLLYSSHNNKEIVGKKDDFIINTGFIHKSGVLLFDLANEKLLDDFAVTGSASTNSVCESKLHCNEELPDVDKSKQIHMCMSEVEQNRRATSGTNLIMTGRETSHDLLTSGFAGTLGEFGKLTGKESRVSRIENNDDDDVVNAAESEPDYLSDNEDMKYHPADEEVFGETDEDEPVMDLFRQQHCKHAPYQACRPSFVPEKIERQRLMRRKKLGLKTLLPLGEFLQQHFYHSLPKGSISATEDDFTIIFGKMIRNLERRRMKAIKDRLSQCPQYSDTQSEGDIQSEEEAEKYDYDNEPNNGYFSDDADNLPKTPNDGNLTFANVPNEDLGGRVHISSLYMNFDDLALNTKSSEQMTYQDLLKVHLQKYWSSAEETTSKLCKRVQLWEEKIQPLLEEEETRREFDIHQYSTELLQQYESIGQTKNFVELVRHVTARHDISRYGLALLMLANAGNIEIDSGHEVEKSNDGKSLYFKLLKNECHQQEFQGSSALSK